MLNGGDDEVKKCPLFNLGKHELLEFKDATDAQTLKLDQLCDSVDGIRDELSSSRGMVKELVKEMTNQAKGISPIFFLAVVMAFMAIIIVRDIKDSNKSFKASASGFSITEAHKEEPSLKK